MKNEVIAFKPAEFSARACVATHNGVRYMVQRRADAQRWHVYANGMPLCSDTHTIEDAFATVRMHAAQRR